MKSRRERREEARKSGKAFEPQYSSGQRIQKDGTIITVGGAPKTHKEMHGVGYERFNNKFVTIKEVEEETVETEVTE